MSLPLWFLIITHCVLFRAQEIASEAGTEVLDCPEIDNEAAEDEEQEPDEYPGVELDQDMQEEEEVTVRPKDMCVPFVSMLLPLLICL